MSLTSKILLNSRHTKKDGTQAIIVRITLNRKSFEISTGYSVNPKYWNESKSEIKTNCPDVSNVTRLNKLIRQKRVDFEDKIITLQENNEISSLTLSQIKNRLTNKKPENTIFSFTDKIIKELKTAGKVGNARVYQTLRNSLSNYLKEKDSPLRSINYKFLKSYEAWYLGKGNSINGLSVHLRTLRSVLNRATVEGLLSKDDYAFKDYSIKTVKTKKRAITEEDILKLKYYVPDSPQKQRAKDTFFLSFYLMGASFIDLAFLKLSNIVNGRIEYRRRKTGQLHSIKITPPLQDILDRYIENKSNSDFILNVITSKDEAKQYVQAREELKRVNKRLKNIGLECDISQPLTSYVARHTYATIANTKNVPLSVISQSLGHKDQKTTAIYLAQFGNDVMDKYNELIIGE